MNRRTEDWIWQLVLCNVYSHFLNRTKNVTFSWTPCCSDWLQHSAVDQLSNDKCTTVPGRPYLREDAAGLNVFSDEAVILVSNRVSGYFLPLFQSTVTDVNILDEMCADVDVTEGPGHTWWSCEGERCHTVTVTLDVFHY